MAQQFFKNDKAVASENVVENGVREADLQPVGQVSLLLLLLLLLLAGTVNQHGCSICHILICCLGVHNTEHKKSQTSPYAAPKGLGCWASCAADSRAPPAKSGATRPDWTRLQQLPPTEKPTVLRAADASTLSSCALPVMPQLQLHAQVPPPWACTHDDKK